MDVVIFANGKLPEPQTATASSRLADLIIAVDGGANHCHRLGIIPHILLGDFDSIDREILTEYQQKDVDISRYPTNKDKTDLELALDLAIAKQATRITVFAALGGRWDMSLANLLLLAAPDYAVAEITIVDSDTVIRVVREKVATTIEAPLGTTVSLIPLGGDAKGVTVRGLKYPLNNSTLYHTSTRGISNVLIDSPGRVTVEKGIVLVVILHDLINI